MVSASEKLSESNLLISIEKHYKQEVIFESCNTGYMLLKFKTIFPLFCITAVFITPLYAQESLLKDNNGDGSVTYMGFGDSITFGVGDTEFPEGAGYVSRLGGLLGISTINEGVPGEEIIANGVYRFPEALQKSNADLVSVMEGTNDAIKRQDGPTMRNAYQKVVNVSRALGRDILIMTLPPPCCDHGASAPFTDSYSSIAKDVAQINEVTLVDYQRAWRTTCQNPSECELYNLPEGLHPNGAGYDVMSQTLAAAILGIDIFAADGAANLEGALGLPPGAVIVKPEITE